MRVIAGDSHRRLVSPSHSLLKNASAADLDFHRNTATTDRSLVKSIQVTLMGVTDQAIVVGSNTKTAYVQDTLVTQVVLRNALR